MTKLGTAFVEIRPDSANFSTDLRRQLNSAIAALGGPAQAIGLSLGGAIAGGLAVAGVAAARFEKGLSAVAAVANATEGQMEAVRAKALQLGADTAFSATEAAGAMEELVKAGLSVEQVLSGAADAAVALAAAGGVSLETSATLAANALNQFGLSAAQMGKVADVVAGAANASAIGVGDFALSLQQAGAVARTAGLSFADTSLAIAALGNAGIRGSDAGTSLKTFLSNLIPVTVRQKEEFRALGLVTEDGGNKFFTAAGSVKSLAGIAGELSTALRGMTDQQRLATLEVLFGSDAIRAAAIFAREGAAGLNELAGEMGKISAADVAAKRMDNLAGSFEQFTGSLETVLIKAGTPLLSTFRGVVDGGTRVLNVVGDLGGEGSLAADTFSRLADVGGDLVRLLGNVAAAGAPVVATLGQLGGGVVLVGLRAMADVLGPLASLLADNQVAADLLAAVLVGKLAGSVIGLTSSLKIGTGVFATFGPLLATSGVQAATSAATFARFTAAVLSAGGAAAAGQLALGGLAAAASGAATALAATVGVLAANPLTWVALAGFQVVEIQRDTKRARVEAAALRKEIYGPALAKSPTLAAIDEAAKAAGDRLAELRRRRKNAGVNDVLDIEEDISTILAGADKLNGVSIKVKENIAAIANATGLSDLGVQALAAHLDVDLSGPFTKTTTKVISGAREMGQALLATGGDVTKAIGLTEAGRKAAEELAESMASSFGAASDILAGFKLPDINVGGSIAQALAEQSKGSEAAAKSSEAVARAQDRVAAAQERLNAAQAEDKPEKVVAAQRGLAAASRELEQTQSRLATASTRTGGGVLSSLRAQLAEATTFQTNISKLLESGVDPTLIRELAEAGPKASAAAVAGVLAEVRAGHTEAVNATAASLRDAQDAIKGQSLAFFREQLAETQRFAGNIRELIAANLDPTLIRKLAEAGPEAAAGAAAGLVAEVRAGNVGAINQTQADLRGALSGLRADVESATGPLAQASRKLGESTIRAFPLGMNEAVELIKADIASILSAELLTGVDTEALKALARVQGSEVGAGMAAGVADGISKANPAIAGAVKGLIDSASSKAKEHAGIRSPSRLFADQIGGPLALGIAQGMKEASAAVLAEAESVVRAAAAVRVPVLDAPGSVSLASSPAVAAGGHGSGSGARAGLVIENLTVDARGSDGADEIVGAIDRKLGWAAANAAYETPLD